MDLNQARSKTDSVSVAELKRRGVALSAPEAVAIIQKLIHEHRCATAVPPFGPPSPRNVELTPDGAVVCLACEITPAVAELAILLQNLLPIGAALPGGLRYAIARALHEIDAPPFDSLQEFSLALAPYEEGDRTVVIRRLLRRAAWSPSQPVAEPRLERRRTGRGVAEMRRHLREADRRMYEARPAAPPLVLPPAPGPSALIPSAAARSGSAASSSSSSRIVAVAVGVAAGLLLIVSGEIVHRRRPSAPAPPMPEQAVPVRRHDVRLPTPAHPAVVATKRVPQKRSSRPTHTRVVAPEKRTWSRTRFVSDMLPRIRFVDDFSLRH